MKVTTCNGLLLAVGTVTAFPKFMTSPDSPLLEALSKRQVQGPGAQPASPPPFDAKLQYVSNKGIYKFVAPGPTDIRGMCPGLNAMANHGYLPHNGRATILQFFEGTQKVFGMSPDLAGFLSVYGAVVDGNGVGWTIESGPHVGIGGSHGNYETDSSPLMGDLNQYGDLSKLIMSQFYDLYNRQPDAATANYNLDVLREFRHDRFQESIQKNPFYYYGPFSGIAVSQAAFTFIYRFMANKSAEAPEGILNKDVLKSFRSITGPEDALVWTKGHERIPDNWYKRHPTDEYSIPYFISDVKYVGEAAPEIFSVGCNQGSVNTFKSISPRTLTNGAYTKQDVMDKPLCLGAAFLSYQAKSLFGLDVSKLSQLNGALNKIMGDCPPIDSFNRAALKSCPGFSIYGGPKGPVAPGAIQN